VSLKRKGRNPLQGKIEARQLHAAAREVLAFADMNTRRHEVDSRAHQYASGKTDIFYIEQKLPSGLWRAYTVEKVGGVTLDVTRELRENLLPALKKDAIVSLGRAGVFSDFEPCKRYVLDECDFRSAGVIGA
jgi:hypothetical protein